MLGNFLEIALSTPDIRASHDFYAALGLSSAIAGDIWTHPYGVMSGGNLALGLHGLPQPSPALVFVRENVAQLARELRSLGLPLATQQLGPDVFNQLSLTDPSGWSLRVIEARSFSPPTAPPAATKLGRFLALSLPVLEFAPLAAFWQRLGYATVEEEAPWPQLRVGGAVPLAYHSRRLHDEPLLLFRQPDLLAATAALADLQLPATGFRRPVESAHLLLTSPEDLCLALLA